MTIEPQVVRTIILNHEIHEKKNCAWFRINTVEINLFRRINWLIFNFSSFILFLFDENRKLKSKPQYQIRLRNRVLHRYKKCMYFESALALVCLEKRRNKTKNMKLSWSINLNESNNRKHTHTQSSIYAYRTYTHTLHNFSLISSFSENKHSKNEWCSLSWIQTTTEYIKATNITHSLSYGMIYWLLI